MKIVITILLFSFCCAAGFSQGRLQGTYISARQLFIPKDTSVKIGGMHEGRTAFVKNNLVGFIDTAGTIVVPPLYSFYTSFKNGVSMLITPKRKYGMLDTTGRIVLPFEYDMFYPTTAANLFVIYKGGFTGLTDSRGGVRIAADKYKAFYQPPPVIRMRCGWQPPNQNMFLMWRNMYGEAFQLTKYIGVLENGLWGYADTTGREVIAPKYKSISLFNFGMAYVSEGAEKMLIDTTGKVIFRADYDTLIPLSPEIILMSRDGKYGALNKAGGEIIPAAYDALSITNNHTILLLKGKFYGVADRSGRVIVQPKYDAVDAVPHGYVVGGYYTGYTLLDSNGNKVFGFTGNIVRGYNDYGILSDNNQSGWLYNEEKKVFEKYDRIWPLGKSGYAYMIDDKIGVVSNTGVKRNEPIYSQVEAVEINTSGQFQISGFFRIMKAGKYGLLNRNLTEVLHPEYEAIGNFTNGMAPVKKEGKYAFMDTAGRLITPFKYDWAGGGYSYYEYQGKRYSHPLVQAGIGGKYGFLNRQGKEVTEMKFEYSYGSFLGNYFLKTEGKNGMIDSTGKEVIPFIYDALDYFESARDVMLAQKDGKKGVVSVTGQVVVPPVYDRVEEGRYTDSLFIVTLNGKSGAVDRTGKEVLPLNYDRIELSDHGFWLLIQGKKTGFYAARSKKIFPPEYDEAVIATDNLLLVRKGELWGIADTANHLLYPVIYKSGHAYSNATELYDEAGKRIFIDHEPFIFPYRRAYAVPGILPGNYLAD